MGVLNKKQVPLTPGVGFRVRSVIKGLLALLAFILGVSNHTLFADMILIIRQADDFSKYSTTLINYKHYI